MSIQEEKIPMLDQEQSQLQQELEKLKEELYYIQRKARNLERDNHFLALMNENADQIRDFHEREILLNKEKAEEASQAKTSFLAQMSHEMRTPLNAIKVLSELLLHTDLNKIQQDYAKNIVNASTSLVNIINDLLDFSKLDAKKIEINEESYDFASFIGDVTNIINLKAVDKNIVFLTDVSPVIPAMLMGDDLRIKQILLNLLNNAVKYTSNGYIKLTAEKMNRGSGQVHLVFTVEDTGIGIKEEFFDKIFEPFFQLEHEGIVKEGNGLGLSIAFGFLELMNGNIFVKSEYGKGSRFTFTVPQGIVDETPIAKVNNIENKRALILGETLRAQACAQIFNRLSIPVDIAVNDGEFLELVHQNQYSHLIYYYELFHSSVKKNTARMKNTNIVAVKDIRYAGIQQTKPSVSVLFEPIIIDEIAKILNYSDERKSIHEKANVDEIGSFYAKDASVLVVDDNEVNLMVMEQLLNQYNINPILAENGSAALDITKNQRFDIIFMDHMMPVMDGIEASQKIRLPDNPNSATPIIMVTANAVIGMKEEFLNAGLDDYISKPIDIKELNIALREWLPMEKITEELPDGLNLNGEKPLPLFIQSLSALDLSSREVYNSLGENEDTYMAIIDTFIESVPEILDKLQVYNEQKDYDAFRIDIHGIKSALANIGAKKLSNVARGLEMACKENDVEYITTRFPVFYEETAELVGNIEMIRPAKSQMMFRGATDKAEQLLDKDGAFDILKRIVERLEGLDTLEALDELAYLAGHLSQEYHDQYFNELSDLKKRIENFDYDRAIDDIQSFLKTYSG